MLNFGNYFRNEANNLISSSKKNSTEPNEHTKKVLKQAKDSRINIKIFLGQTVQQQDSSDNGVSDTECSVIQREPAAVPNLPQQQQQGNQKAEVENSVSFSLFFPPCRSHPPTHTRGPHGLPRIDLNFNHRFFFFWFNEKFSHENGPTSAQALVCLVFSVFFF